MDINRERAGAFVQKIEKALSPLDGKTIAVLGLAFKPNTDDMREAKSVEVIARLTAAGAAVRAYDPVAMPNARRMLPASVRYWLRVPLDRPPDGPAGVRRRRGPARGNA